MALRRALHALGLRYRVNVAPLPASRRRADVVFPRAKLAVFVDGCFWHCCPQHGSMPRNNGEWWAHKLAANVCRDRATDAQLEEHGWAVERIWEHDDAEAAANRIAARYRSRIGRI